jgi:polyphosphate kinase
VREYFQREVRPLLIPVGLDPSHPFPQVANKSLNFIVRLGGKDAFGRANEIAIVKVPRVLPRLIRMPDARWRGAHAVRLALQRDPRAPGGPVSGPRGGQFSQFRVTRHSDLAVDEEDVQEPAHRLAPGPAAAPFTARPCGWRCRRAAPRYLAEFPAAPVRPAAQALYRVHGPVNLVRLTQLIDLVDEPELLFAPTRPLPGAAATLANPCSSA